MTDIISLVSAISDLLWTFAGLLLFAVFVWFLWNVLQIVRDLAGLLRDRIGFDRGEIRKAAQKAGIEIVYEAEPAKRKSKIQRCLLYTSPSPRD